MDRLTRTANIIKAYYSYKKNSDSATFVKEVCGFFDFIKVNYGVTFENRVLGIADIALVNYRDKIKDYSFDALLTRFCPVSEREKETGNAEIVARIFERLALEDDFAHCGY